MRISPEMRAALEALPEDLQTRVRTEWKAGRRARARAWVRTYAPTIVLGWGGFSVWALWVLGGN